MKNGNIKKLLKVQHSDRSWNTFLVSKSVPVLVISFYYFSMGIKVVDGD